MKRLDQILVERGLCASRAQATRAITGGHVSVDGAVINKASVKFGDEAHIEVHDPNAQWVSRGALKILPILHDVQDKIALDLGASTGGFTQVLLSQGASHVFAIDVGHGQLHESLANDPRVTSVEKCNVKTLTANTIAHDDWPNFEIITCDLSFISLTKALPAALDLSAQGTVIFALVKPQFELEPSDIGKGGIVKSEELQKYALESVIAFFEAQSWKIIRTMKSPILGGDGNLEYLLEGVKL